MPAGRRGRPALAAVEPWVVGAAVAGTLLAGATGLLVWGQAQTTLRAGHLAVGTAHFWLGIALTVVVAVLAGWRLRRVQQGRHTHGHALVAGGALALVAVMAQGYLGGRMTYDQGVGVDRGGEFAQTGSGAAALEAALARGLAPADAGAGRSRAAASAARAATATRRRACAARASPAASSSGSSAASTATGCSRPPPSATATSPPSTPGCARCPAAAGAATRYQLPPSPFSLSASATITLSFSSSRTSTVEPSVLATSTS
ncbi:MAG: DUF2231 domain-containing protein [Solirubrobacteraceae bacterium]